VLAGTLDSTAFGMTQHNNNLGSGYLAGKFHGSKNIVIQYIARYPDTENVAQALVKYQFGACPGINTTEDDSERVLPVSRVVHLLKQVTIHFEVVYKAHIAVFQQFKRIQGTQFALNLFSECTHVGSFSSFENGLKGTLREPEKYGYYKEQYLCYSWVTQVFAVGEWL
jgi:hypothetical protein